jgi:hypothetical protein
MFLWKTQFVAPMGSPVAGHDPYRSSCTFVVPELLGDVKKRSPQPSSHRLLSTVVRRVGLAHASRLHDGGGETERTETSLQRLL